MAEPVIVNSRPWEFRGISPYKILNLDQNVLIKAHIILKDSLVIPSRQCNPPPDLPNHAVFISRWARIESIKQVSHGCPERL
jgi:hypothetical protein